MEKIDLLDGNYLYYDDGRFDQWCVYIVSQNGERKPPRDVEYFSELQTYFHVLDRKRLYDDYVKVYDLVTPVFSPLAVQEIKKIAEGYGELQNELFRIFSILYMGMISEEHKKGTRLGKRIKRLGIHFLLIKNASPEYCANFMRGKPWREIDKICRECGF